MERRGKGVNFSGKLGLLEKIKNLFNVHRSVRELPSAKLYSLPFVGGLLDTMTSILNSLSQGRSQKKLMTEAMSMEDL